MAVKTSCALPSDSVNCLGEVGKSIRMMSHDCHETIWLLQRISLVICYVKVFSTLSASAFIYIYIVAIYCVKLYVSFAGYNNTFTKPKVKAIFWSNNIQLCFNISSFEIENRTR